MQVLIAISGFCPRIGNVPCTTPFDLLFVISIHVPTWGTTFINICVATGLAPNTGTPLPFVSYGLTSLVSLFMGMGLVLNVGLQSSTYNKELQKKEQKKDAYFRKEEYL